MSLFSSAPDSICILRLSAIGDVCNTISVIQSVQRQWPETKITWITGKLEAHLVRQLPGIEVIEFDKKLGIKGYLSLWQRLKDRKFDALLHMQYAFRASIATLGIKAQYKLGFDATRSQDFQRLFTNIKVTSPSSTHVLDGLMAFSHQLGIKDTTPKWTIPYTSEDKAWALEHLSKVKRNLVIVPAASKGYKNWTISGYVDLIKHAQSNGWNVILAGSPAQIELDLSTEIEAKVSAPISNLVGNSSLIQMLALLDSAQLVVAPDTGPTHMANAMNTPVIGLYAHHNPERTGPYNYRQYVVSVWQQVIEQEIGKSIDALPWRSRVKNKQAMQLISSHDVIAMFDHVCKEEAL